MFTKCLGRDNLDLSFRDALKNICGPLLQWGNLIVIGVVLLVGVERIFSRGNNRQWRIYVVAQATTCAKAVKGITSPMVWKPPEASFSRTARGEANRSKTGGDAGHGVAEVGDRSPLHRAKCWRGPRTCFTSLSANDFLDVEHRVEGKWCLIIA